jgi:hypothetical protein
MKGNKRAKSRLCSTSISIKVQLDQKSEKDLGGVSSLANLVGVKVKR